MNLQNLRSRSAAIIAGVVSGWFGYVVGIVCTFFLTPLIIQGLGTIGYGVWSLITTISGYYGLADLGVGVATTKFLSQHLESGDHREVYRILKASSRTYLRLSVPIVLVSVAIGLAVPCLVDLEHTSRTSFLLSVVFLGANASLLLLGTVFRSYLRARRAFSCINVLGVAAQIATATTIGWIVTHGGNIVVMAADLFFIGLVQLLFIVWLAVYKFEFPWREMWQHPESQSSELFKLGGLVIASRSVHKVSQKIGTLGAVTLGGPAMVSFYSIAETVCEKAMATMVPVRQMVVPTSSAIYESTDRNAQVRFSILAPRMFLTIGAGIVCGIFLYGQTFLGLWIGDDFALKCWPILKVLAIAIPLRMLSGCLGLLLQGRGDAAYVTKAALIEGGLLITLVFILCMRFGESGLAFAVVASVFVTAILLLPKRVNSDSGLRLESYVLSVFLPPMFAGLIGWTAGLLLVQFHEPSSYLGLLAHGTIFSAVGGLVTFIVCADKPLRQTVLDSLKRRLSARWKHRDPATTEPIPVEQ